LSIGTVSSGAAAATITGTAPNQTLNLVLPTGANGATGATGGGGMMWVANIGTNYQCSYTSFFAPPGYNGDPTQCNPNTGLPSFTTTATNAYIQPFGSCTLDSMLILNYTGNGSIPVTAEVYVNGAGQAGLKCTAVATDGATCSVTGQSVAVAATDKISLGLTTTGNFQTNGLNAPYLNGGIMIALHCK
jgi:hypothetical protein